MSTYEFWQSFAAKWGFVYFAALFAIACGYALWPSKKKHFENAARLPLDED
ncbi:MAG: cbb3-type cytochrome c oxidase subunit 3 [Hyphomicrobiales bacterium]